MWVFCLPASPAWSEWHTSTHRADTGQAVSAHRAVQLLALWALTIHGCFSSCWHLGLPAYHRLESEIALEEWVKNRIYKKARGCSQCRTWSDNCISQQLAYGRLSSFIPTSSHFSHTYNSLYPSWSLCFSTLVSFQKTNPLYLLFPHWSWFCYVHNHIWLFWYGYL